MRHPSLLEKKRSSTPAEFADYVAEKGNVYWWAPGKFWVITKYNTAEHVLKHEDFSCDRSRFFISRMPNLDLKLIPDFFAIVQKMMVMSDAKKHLSRRQIAATALTPERMEYFRPFVHRTVDSLLDQVANKEGFDFVSEIAEKLPSIVLADLFCIPERDRPDFYQWSHNMTQFFGGASQYRNEDGIEVNKSASKLRSYFAELVSSVDLTLKTIF